MCRRCVLWCKAIEGIALTEVSVKNHISFNTVHSVAKLVTLVHQVQLIRDIVKVRDRGGGHKKAERTCPAPADGATCAAAVKPTLLLSAVQIDC